MNKLALVLTSLCLASASTAQLGMKFTNGGPVDQYIDVPYHSTLLPATGLTVEAWITYDGSTLAPGWRWPCIVRQNVNPNAESFVFRVDAANTQSRSIKFAVRTTTPLSPALEPQGTAVGAVPPGVPGWPSPDIS